MSDYTSDEQAANRAKLVEALRSGKYEQGQGQLRLTQGAAHRPLYCCLGVACDISGLGDWAANDEYAIPDGHANRLHLPNAVREWLGFASENGVLDEDEYILDEQNRRHSLLSNANDSGATFATIANAIEADKVATV